MNTVKKGDLFEDRVFSYINNELEGDTFFVSGKSSQAYQKKKYFSKDRQSDIITDISIETFISGASDYSLLTVVECKDYNHSIPVDDIEEFFSKTQQIAGVNVKAIFATSSAFQKSALEFAKSKKIGVIRFLPDDQVQWVFYNRMPSLRHRVPSLDDEVWSALLDQNYISENEYFYACTESENHFNLSIMLRSYLEIDS